MNRPTPRILCLASAAFLISPLAMAQTDAASPPGTAMTPPAAAAPAGRGGKLSHADRSFMKEAAQAGSAEVASAQLAEGKSGDAKVQAFAKQMIGDHAEAGDAL